MAANPNLNRRPIVARARDRVLGFDEAALARLLG
jgi:arsenate reductase-like glutaredoxin family protein